MISLFTRALALVFGIVTKARNAAYDFGLLHVYRSRLPVISVGNATVGGTGKTPLCLWIVAELTALGRRPVVLTRGYRGIIWGPHVVQPHDSAELVGDEAVLLAREAGVPVVVCRRRAAGARFVEDRDLGDVIILDDGLQHRALARDVNIVTVYVGDVKARAAFCAGHLLPHGPFRESRAGALARTDVIVWTTRRISDGSNISLHEVKALVPQWIPQFECSLAAPKIRSITGEKQLAPPAKLFAFCAIANQAAFFDTLRQAGFELGGTQSFPDHHPFTPGDIALLEKKANGLPLVCSSKDAVKLEFARDRTIFVVQLQVALDRGDALTQMLDDKLRNK